MCRVLIVNRGEHLAATTKLGCCGERRGDRTRGRAPDITKAEICGQLTNCEWVDDTGGGAAFHGEVEAVFCVRLHIRPVDRWAA